MTLGTIYYPYCSRYTLPLSHQSGFADVFKERNAKEEQRLVGQLCHSYTIPWLAKEGFVVRGLSLQKRMAGVVDAAVYMICIHDRASQIIVLFSKYSVS